jgi:acetoin utilization deacetylase AcuC-like enzyme
MPTTLFVSHEDASLHDGGWDHPDHQGRLPAIVRAVQRDIVALWEPLDQREAVPAPEAELLRVHSAAHVERVRAAVAAAAAAGRPGSVDGVPVSGASLAAALASVGGAIDALRGVAAGEARNGFVLARPPGRDAHPDRSAGCSLFNTVAIAARHAVEEGVVPSALVVAWGDGPAGGLAASLAGDARVRLVAIDAARAGAGFVAAQRAALAACAEAAPGMVLLSAGFDLPEEALTEIHALTAELVAWCGARAGGRLVSVLEGGYDAAATARAVVQHLRALAGLGPA